MSDVDRLVLNNKLTIILTIKGRQEYTFRWIEYVRKRKFPFTILIADGGSDDFIQKYIDKNEFKGLRLKYVRFGDDIDFSAYYNKNRKSLDLVETPYCIFADNDDFYSLHGLNDAIKFLDENKDYVACGGKLAPFMIEDGQIYGSRASFYRSGHSHYFEKEPKDRVIKYLNGSPGPYYSVTRSNILRDVWGIICNQNFKDIRMPEILVDTYILSSGKVYQLNYPFYFRQVGMGVGNTAGLTHDFFDEVFAPTWSSEINFIANIVVEKCGEDKFPHKDFWFYMKRYLLPRVLNGVAPDAYGRNSTKIRKIMLGKALMTGGIVGLMRELFFSLNQYENIKGNVDIGFIIFSTSIPKSFFIYFFS